MIVTNLKQLMMKIGKITADKIKTLFLYKLNG